MDSGGLKEAQVQLYSPGGTSVLSWEDTLAPPVEYDRTICLNRSIWVVELAGPKEAQVQSYLPGGANVPSPVGTLVPPGKHD